MTIRDLMEWSRPSQDLLRKRSSNFNSLESLQQEMNNFFERLYAGLNVKLTDWDGKSEAVPAVDIIEDNKSFTVKAELAGVEPKDVDVEVTDGFVSIRSKRSKESEEKKEEKGMNYIRREISEGFYQRTLALPESADCDKAEASFKNGILTISVPKKAEALKNPKKLEIKKAA